mmetsp:Transcript_8451/g.18554  ORF Transcript_8451/g.18554 Transcript_8451/m.18554 type:complete len:132 (-) Transcript_8451:787-1182(-)
MKDIDVSGNADLNMLHDSVQSNTDVIIFILDLHYKHNQVIEEIERARKDLLHFMDYSKKKMDTCHEQINKTKLDKKKLEMERQSIRNFLFMQTIFGKIRRAMTKGYGVFIGIFGISSKASEVNVEDVYEIG